MNSRHIDVASLEHSAIGAHLDPPRGPIKARSSARLGMLSLALIAVALGCASLAPNLVRQGAVTMEYSPSHYSAHWSRVSVRRTESGTAISGELHKQSLHRGKLSGHVDIEVVSPDGALLAQTETRYDYVSATGKIQRAGFSTVLSLQVPEGSTVRLNHHGVAAE
nr:hypothetical protein [Gammaproteobacteria bacterium]